ncbi:MAG: RNA polymerase sigma factor [Clostridium sp.]|nr:RNA polymerase sigma factor [Clostridium sp.]
MSQLNTLFLITQTLLLHNDRAFGRLVEQHQSDLRRFLLSLTGGDGMLADDLAQETFLRAYRHLATFKGTAHFKTWLLRIAYNTFYDYLRNSKTDSGEQAEAAQALPTTDAGRNNLKMDLATAMTILSAAERTCVTLRLQQGLSVSQIAKLTGWPEGTVKSHTSRGRQKLADFLRRNGYDK